MGGQSSRAEHSIHRGTASSCSYRSNRGGSAHAFCAWVLCEVELVGPRLHLRERKSRSTRLCRVRSSNQPQRRDRGGGVYHGEVRSNLCSLGKATPVHFQTHRERQLQGLQNA